MPIEPAKPDAAYKEKLKATKTSLETAKKQTKKNASGYAYLHYAACMIDALIQAHEKELEERLQHKLTVDEADDLPSAAAIFANFNMALFKSEQQLTKPRPEARYFSNEFRKYLEEDLNRFGVHTVEQLTTQDIQEQTKAFRKKYNTPCYTAVTLKENNNRTIKFPTSEDPDSQCRDDKPLVEVLRPPEEQRPKSVSFENQPMPRSQAEATRLKEEAEKERKNYPKISSDERAERSNKNQEAAIAKGYPDPSSGAKSAGTRQTVITVFDSHPKAPYPPQPLLTGGPLAPQPTPQKSCFKRRHG